MTSPIDLVDQRSLSDEKVFITSKALAQGIRLTLADKDGNVIAHAFTPNAGKRLSDYAFDRGAKEVKHAYDLRIDDQ